MSRQATVVELSEDDRRTLEDWVRSGSTQQRLVVRARIVLAAAQGEATTKIASGLGVDPTTVSKWRMRFAAAGLPGLSDAVRSGAPERYGEESERRVLAMLDQPPPAGYGAWTGGLLAKALGDVSPDQVWRVLRKHRIQLVRRRSWCVSADPEFAAKAADIVGLYLAPPENAIVLCVDEKPHIQALERAQGWLRLPNGKALTGFSHEYKRHGTTTLFGALEVATGQVKAGHYHRKRRREFLDFMNELVAGYPSETELHVVLDNLSTHKPRHDRWLKRHPNVHFHFTPTHASWLNQIEIWFSLLWRQALRGVSFTSPRQVRQAIDAYLAAYRQTAHPFEWKKQLVHPTSLKHNLTDLRN
jgi:transposase